MIGNKVVPTTTATSARVQLYQPTQRPRVLAGEWIETAWGRCRVTGRLGQRHADLIEAVLFHAEKKREIGGGQVELLVDPARVRASMSDDRYSLDQVWKLLGEARQANCEIETNNFKVLGGLIDHVLKTRTTRRNPLGGGQRQLWTVRLGLPLCVLLENDIPRFYDPAPLARLTHGISQAVARHILSHQAQPRGGWILNGLIKAVAGDLRDQQMRDARRRVHADASGLEAVGVLVDKEGGRVRVAQPPDSVAQPPGAWRSRPTQAGLSGTSVPPSDGPGLGAHARNP